MESEMLPQNKEASSSTDEPFPYNYRKWIPEFKTETLLSKLKHPNHLIRVVQYNILCDSLLPISTKIIEEDIKLLPHLSWENRSQKILNELKTINADLIGLTEIENDVNFIKKLHESNYEFALKPRPGKHSEGCGIAWKINKFELIDLLCIEYNMNNTPNDQSPIYGRDNVALIGILKVNEISNTIILFVNTHLLFNSNRGDIKLGQIYQLTITLDELRKKYEQLNNKVYIIVTSDLNSIPKSAVYKLLTTGKLDCNKIEKRSISGQDADNLQYVNPPTKIRSYLFSRILGKYNDDNSNNNNIKKNYKNDGIPNGDNNRWYNEICRVKPKINEHHVNLEYNNEYRHKDTDLILELPFKYESAYSNIAKSIFENLSENNNKLPFNILENELNEVEINAIKMGKRDIEKTKSFIKNLTLENPVSSYSNDTVSSLDYIFYYSKENDMKPVRVLNVPDIYSLFFDIGYMPNDIFPSDHLSLAADIIIGEETL